MQQKEPVRPEEWNDRTLTTLRTSRLEACEKELAGLGGSGLFDAETTDLEAETLFGQSYDLEEERKKRLHRIEEMRVAVLSRFPAEMSLLSEEEYTLALKLALFGGEMPIHDWNDLIPARSLIRRMWCRARPEKGRWIRMPRQICVAVLMMLASEELKTVRETVAEVVERADNTLYLAGMMPAAVVEKDLGFRLQGSLAADKPLLYRRLLRASYETTVNRGGQLMLVHPGMAEPCGFPRTEIGLRMGLDAGALNDLYASLMEVEDPVYDRMLALIQPLCRPETGAEETVEDLILLAKQDADMEELRQTLASRIICLPTGEMEAALQEMRDRIPRWRTLNMERIQ